MSSSAQVSHDPDDDNNKLQHHAPERPSFNSHDTTDRLREASRLPPQSTVSNIRKGRKSIFRETGLHEPQPNTSREFEEKEFGKITGLASEYTSPTKRKGSVGESTREKTRWLSRLAPSRRPAIKTAASAPTATITGLHRLAMIALLIAVVLPALSYNNGRGKVEIRGADAGVIQKPPGIVLENRADSSTDVCKRWAGQSAAVNGTLYYFGGRSKTSGDQTSDTWNNDFLALDLTKSWDITSPALSGLAQPSGPPAVSLGYLWNDYEHLFLYGGEFSDTPVTTPTAVSTWQYDIASSTWTEFKNPVTSAGNYSTAADVPIQRAAEGAGISVPELGVSWYFGGHLDAYTTPGWSVQVARVYLRSLLEFTHPGYANSGVDSLHASAAPDGGAYRNITQGGIQDEAGFTERADGALVYVPGWGPNGILLGLGGGVVTDSDSSAAFASMTTIDVYDIESSEWYHQETSGDAPQVRVNPCTVVFSAPDASSFNVYMYGGQNLLPVGSQVQYTDVWILTIPSFTWIKVDTSTSTNPAGRAGHQCAAHDGQMVVFGGYTGNETTCENPGIFSFDASSLAWKDSFAAADHAADIDPDNSILAGSYGYQVPGAVQSVIGGSSAGGATATQPASGPATDGPFKTGTAPVFTVTAAGSTATPTTVSASSRRANTGGLIAAGVVAGLAGLAAIYLGFCAWLWRRQVRAYRAHMAVANRYSNDGSDRPGMAENQAAEVAGAAGMMLPTGSRDRVEREKLRKSAGPRGTGSSGAGSDQGEQFGWVGQQQHLGEPKWMTSSEDPSPGSGSAMTGSGSGPTSIPRPSEDRSPWGYDSYAAGVGRSKSGASRASDASGASADGLMDGREPNFFSIVLGPRRALRVVNGMEDAAPAA
ncbi:Uu.00g012710.m01.CDS01 [Anthostomella pinea]|uniref:Uu.00g012710.m01.CDS01 n=1 Tax=Anthostomella pinea TaxID=933095 RepID=A0AAI8VY21_9PEZI|nr:Uu.00g012710.m01.CDS01 [Anthostomella pinea]